MKNDDKLDFCWVLVGRPGCGKTTRARKLVAPMVASMPVVVHDPRREWSGKKWPGHWNIKPGLYVKRTGPTDDLILSRYEYCSGQEAAGKPIRPATIVVDEGSAWGGERVHNPLPSTKELLGGRRHFQTGFVVLAQVATMLPQVMWGVCQGAIVFRVVPRDVKLLNERGVLRDISNAPRFAVGESVVCSFSCTDYG